MEIKESKDSFQIYVSSTQHQFVLRQPSTVFSDNHLVTVLSSHALNENAILNLALLKKKKAQNIKVMADKKQQLMDEFSENISTIQRKFARIHGLIQNGPRVFHSGLLFYGKNLHCSEPSPGIITFIQSKGFISVYQVNSDMFKPPKHSVTVSLPFQPTIVIETQKLRNFPPLVEYFCATATRHYIIHVDYKLPEVCVSIVQEQEFSGSLALAYAAPETVIVTTLDSISYFTNKLALIISIPLCVRVFCYDADMNCVLACTDTHLLSLSSTYKITLLYALPTVEKITGVFGFDAVSNHKQILITCKSKSYSVNVNLMNNNITSSELKIIVRDAMSWENGHVGYANGMINFYDEDLWECWKTKVGDEMEDVEKGQGLCVIGRGNSAFVIYWKGNTWCCLTGYNSHSS